MTKLTAASSGLPFSFHLCIFLPMDCSTIVPVLLRESDALDG